MPAAAACHLWPASLLCLQRGNLFCAALCACTAWYAPRIAVPAVVCVAQVVARQNAALAALAADAKKAFMEEKTVPANTTGLLDALVARQHCRMEGCFATLPPGSGFNQTIARNLWQVRLRAVLDLQQHLPLTSSPCSQPPASACSHHLFPCSEVKFAVIGMPLHCPCYND